MGSFQTSEDQSDPALRPLRVPSLKDGIYAEAKTMVADLPRWKLLEADDRALVLRCEREGGLLAGKARITISVEGPDGIPSATVHVRSESDGGLLARDKAYVSEFTKPFHRRVC